MFGLDGAFGVRPWHGAAAASSGARLHRSLGARALLGCARGDLREELRSATVEPLLPIEKKLIAWSLGIGLSLLVVLAVINHLYPPGS